MGREGERGVLEDLTHRMNLEEEEEAGPRTREGPSRHRQSLHGEPEWAALSMLVHVMCLVSEEQSGKMRLEGGEQITGATLESSDHV